MNAYVDFNVLGKVDIRKQLNSAYLRNKLECNQKVTQNCNILRRLMCIKLCGGFEFALHDEKSISDNTSDSVYLGLINFAAELNSVFKRCLSF